MCSVRFQKPPSGYELDHGQGLYRIGLLALANDNVIERDMMSMRPDDDQVHIFVARVPFEGNVDCENLRAMARRITEATDTLLPGGRLDSVIFGCTSGTAAIGYEGVANAINAARPEATCVSPVTAAHAAFAALGLKHIAVLAPYTDDVTYVTVRALLEGGVEVAKVSNFGILASNDISAVTSASIREGAIFADDPVSEGLFISCTDFRAVQVIEEVEAKICKPVITANQAAFWQAIRMAGYDRPISGYGKLLRL
ncbi:MAG: hypothetical protein OXI87_04390 [Albidovulum sp.]|nr:hypothetical protein [Albidovulum sp.]MDE0304114.1 hypothetical protein [Albidovulum sp.]MDE0533381.1 hypothetical protein [Albidovulum sp.]